MSEQDMRRKVVTTLKAQDALSVENPAYPGTPDVNYIEGWIELKWLREWPVGNETVVSFPHFSPQQRVWLIRRWRAGGAVHLLVQVRQEWLLFSGEKAARLIGKSTRQQLIDNCDFYWDDGKIDNLYGQLTKSRTVNHSPAKNEHDPETIR